MDPADGRHQVYTMDMWNYRHRGLEPWNQLVFSSCAASAPSVFPALHLDGSQPVLSIWKNRLCAMVVKDGMNKLRQTCTDVSR